MMDAINWKRDPTGAWDGYTDDRRAFAVEPVSRGRAVVLQFAGNGRVTKRETVGSIAAAKALADEWLNTPRRKRTA